jgi:hypothetical protein
VEEKKQSVAPENGMSRRQVMVGAAWAAPVVALAVAAPMAAASNTPPQYEFAGISATGTAGETLTGDARPGARIRDANNSPVAGEIVVFAYVDGPFRLNDVTATTDVNGRALVGVTFDAEGVPGPLGAIEATWAGADGKKYVELVEVSIEA